MKIWFCSVGGIRLARYTTVSKKPIRIGEGRAPMVDIDDLIFGVYNEDRHCFEVPADIEKRLGIVSFNFVEIEVE